MTLSTFLALLIHILTYHFSLLYLSLPLYLQPKLFICILIIIVCPLLNISIMLWFPLFVSTRPTTSNVLSWVTIIIWLKITTSNIKGRIFPTNFILGWTRSDFPYASLQFIHKPLLFQHSIYHEIIYLQICILIIILGNC